MSFDYKITDLLYKIDNLVPKDVCNYFIKIFEDNINEAYTERSYKFKDKIQKEDNFVCVNLSVLAKMDSSFEKPLDLAKKYIAIMISNYVLHIKKMFPTFDDSLFKTTRNIRILRYQVGECIEDHSDAGDYIRGSCTLNLNQDYEGGEFRFFDGKKKISLKTGDSIFFPADIVWVHGTEPITKGTRYSINCFLSPYEINISNT